MSNTNDIYYQKYLKYKAKYTDLKQQGGLLTLQNGIFAFFCSSEVADAICPTVHSATLSNSKINDILEKSGPAYRAKNGDLKLTIVTESYLKKTGNFIGNTASAAASGLSRAASATASGLSKAASATVNALDNAALAAESGLNKAASGLNKAATAAGSSIYKGSTLLKNKVLGETVKVTIDEVKSRSPNSSPRSRSPQRAGAPEKTPTIIKLNAPLETNNKSQLRETGNILKAINSSIDTVVVIEIKSFGSNMCLNKFSL